MLVSAGGVPQVSSPRPLSPVADLGDALVNDDRVVGLWSVSAADLEQDGVLPNLAKDPVLGPLMPGSVHGLWFGKRSVGGVTEDALLLDQRSVASLVNAPIPALSSSTQWTVTAKIDPASTGASRRVFYCSKPGGVLDTEKLYYFDGTTLHTASSTVQTLLGISQGTPFWARWKVAGTSLTIDCSADGSTWVNALTSTLAASIALTGTLDIGSSSTTDGFHGWFYSLQVRDGDENGPVVADWTPDLHPAGSRADSDTGIDPVGTVWTVTRPSTADSNDPTRIAHDGTNKVWLPGATGNYLESSAAPDLAGVTTIQAVLSSPGENPGADATAVGQYKTSTNERSWMLYTTSANKWVVNLSDDGTSSSGHILTSTVSDGLVTDHPWWKIEIPTGSGSQTLNCYYSDVSAEPGLGDASWVLDEATSVTAFGVASPTVPVRWGAFDSGYHWSGLLAGTVYGDGAILSKLDPSNATTGAETSWTDSVTGETVTVSRGTSGATTTVVVEDVVITNGSTFLESIWDPALEIQAGESLTVVIVERHWFASNWGRFVAFANTASPYEGWMLLNDGTLASKYLNTRGATQVLLGRSLAEVVYGARQVTEATIDGSSGEMWADDSTVQEISYGADVPVTQPDRNSLTVAVHPDLGSNMALEFFALAILKGTVRITDDEATAHYQELSS